MLNNNYRNLHQMGLDLCSVKINGLSLKTIKNQTNRICLNAVRENGLSLKHVKIQTEEICTAAIMQNPNTLKYIKDFSQKKILTEAIAI